MRSGRGRGRLCGNCSRRAPAASGAMQPRRDVRGKHDGQYGETSNRIGRQTCTRLPPTETDLNEPRSGNEADGPRDVHFTPDVVEADGRLVAEGKCGPDDPYDRDQRADGEVGRNTGRRTRAILRQHSPLPCNPAEASAPLAERYGGDGQNDVGRAASDAGENERDDGALAEDAAEHVGCGADVAGSELLQALRHAGDVTAESRCRPDTRSEPHDREHRGGRHDESPFGDGRVERSPEPVNGEPVRIRPLVTWRKRKRAIERARED